MDKEKSTVKTSKLWDGSVVLKQSDIDEIDSFKLKMSKISAPTLNYKKVEFIKRSCEQKERQIHKLINSKKLFSDTETDRILYAYKKARTFWTANELDSMHKSEHEYKTYISLLDGIIAYAKDIADKKMAIINKRNEQKSGNSNVPYKNEPVTDDELHQYIINRQTNMEERYDAASEKKPLMPRNEKRITEFKPINDLFSLEEAIDLMGISLPEEKVFEIIAHYLETDDFNMVPKEYEIDKLLYSIDKEGLLHSLVERGMTCFFFKDAFVKKYPKYMEKRKELFDFITASFSVPDFDINVILTSMIRNPQLLKHLVDDFNIELYDKKSEEFMLLRSSIVNTAKSNPRMFKAYNNLLLDIEDMSFSDNSVSKEKAI